MWTRLSCNSDNAAVKVETQENVSTFSCKKKKERVLRLWMPKICKTNIEIQELLWSNIHKCFKNFQHLRKNLVSYVVFIHQQRLIFLHVSSTKLPQNPPDEFSPHFSVQFSVVCVPRVISWEGWDPTSWPADEPLPRHALSLHLSA